ncbi:MAG: TetR/AcrR family transcriptional regulator [Dermatophilaceae bacterium]
MTVEHGYDGFTMDDLADRVGVSRRTLFNVVPDKESAVLGLAPDFDASEEGARFREGGPSGELVPDLLVMFEVAMARLSGTDAESASQTATDRLLYTEALAADPKVLAMARARAARHTQEVAELIATREDWATEDLRARALSAALGALIRVSFDEVARRDGITPVAEVSRETVAAFAAATRD